MASKYLLARIKDGELVISPGDKVRFADELKKFNGKEVLVEIPDKYKLRTEKQNRYYRGLVCRLISEHTGFTNEEIHQFFRRMLLQYSRKVGGKVYEFTRSTTELNWKEMTDYIEKIRTYVRESETLKSVVIPDPDPDYMFKPKNVIPRTHTRANKSGKSK